MEIEAHKRDLNPVVYDMKWPKDSKEELLRHSGLNQQFGDILSFEKHKESLLYEDNI